MKFSTSEEFHDRRTLESTLRVSRWWWVSIDVVAVSSTCSRQSAEFELCRRSSLLGIFPRLEILALVSRTTTIEHSLFLTATDFRALPSPIPRWRKPAHRAIAQSPSPIFVWLRKWCQQQPRTGKTHPVPRHPRARSRHHVPTSHSERGLQLHDT